MLVILNKEINRNMSNNNKVVSTISHHIDNNNFLKLVSNVSIRTSVITKEIKDDRSERKNKWRIHRILAALESAHVQK